MVDNLSDLMQHEWNLTNSDANNIYTMSNHNHLTGRQSLSRKLSDNVGYNSDYNHGQHHHTNQPSLHSTPTITTTDYSDRSSLGIPLVSRILSTRRSLDTGYDTDGAIGTGTATSNHRISRGYEHFVSPRLSPKRSTNKSSMQLPPVPHRQHSPHRSHLNIPSSSGHDRHQSERDSEESHDGDTRRRHIRLSRRVQARSPINENHGTHASHVSTVPRQERVFSSTRPLKLIFMRHSERANQALGADWFSKAFRTNTYKSFDQNLPIALPKRRSDQAYEFDPPLTVRGLKNARYVGGAMVDHNLVADLCLSSTALRCVQTAQRVLTGMEREDQVPIRIEPGLFECPHSHYKIVESFMTKKELVDNGFNLYLDYKPLISKLTVPESLDDYFDRCVTVMRGIIDRYAPRGGTILIVTHAPGLLALISTINGLRPNTDTFYRTVAAYPPLAFFVAEYNGTRWEHSEQPFSLIPTTQ